MIVQRVFHYPKPGLQGDLVELLKAEEQRFPPLHGFRVYSHDIGCRSPVSQEFEFESHAEREKFWAGWFTDPGTAAFIKKYSELASRYWANEVWNLE